MTSKREHVEHYAGTQYETIDVIFDKLGFNGGLAFVLGNIIKYATRALYKGQLVSDLEKIRNYATIALEKIEENSEEDDKLPTRVDKRLGTR